MEDSERVFAMGRFVLFFILGHRPKKKLLFFPGALDKEKFGLIIHARASKLRQKKVFEN